MLEFVVDVLTVTCGIIVYKRLDVLYGDLKWKWRQRHSSSTHEPWDSW